MTKCLRVIYLMPDEFASTANIYAEAAGLSVSSIVVNTSQDLKKAVSTGCDLLMAFSTSIIVERKVLATPGLVAVNIHGASPEFPGRDPHHFAIYRAAKKYGATIHYMTEKVDSGPIIDTELFDVPGLTRPNELLERATLAGLELMRRFFLSFSKEGWPEPDGKLHWTGLATTRKDFLELCKVECGVHSTEFIRRLNATEMPDRKNLYLELHGYRFRIEGKIE